MKSKWARCPDCSCLQGKQTRPAWNCRACGLRLRGHHTLNPHSTVPGAEQIRAERIAAVGYYGITAIMSQQKNPNTVVLKWYANGSLVAEETIEQETVAL